MFNPFETPIGEAPTAADLNNMIGRVSEGYYVEFKETLPAAKKIANSIASFANTYGGWYIVGVRTDSQHTANDICGFGAGEFKDPVASIRDAVKNRVDPVPVFHIWIVQLSDQRSAVVVHVPADQETPFLSNEGRVYRRNHDSSDPVPEERRHTLDYLYDVGRKREERFARFCSEEKEPSVHSRDGISWLNVFIQPRPLGLVDKLGSISKRGVDEALELSRSPRTLLAVEGSSITGNMPFNHAHFSGGSITLRQTTPGSVTGKVTEVELYPGGSARFHLPVFTPYLKDYPLDTLETDTVRAELEGVLSSPASDDALYMRILDVPALLLNVLLLLAFYRDWIGQQPFMPYFRLGCSFRGAWSLVPLADCPEWTEQVSAWGVPVMTRDVQIPEDWRDPPVFSSDAANGLYPALFYIAARLGFESDLCNAAIMTAFQRAGRDALQRGRNGA